MSVESEADALMTGDPTQLILADVSPLIWSDDVAAICDWAVAVLGLNESWRAPGEGGQVEHAELTWPGGGRISVNIKADAYRNMGPSGVSLRIDDAQRVKAIYAQAVAAGATIIQGPGESRIAYSFTAVDPDGNQWWVNAETGFLDELRGH